MALIHWWPLNGDTKDYGLNPVNLTNNGATVNNSGKIGKCYSFDGSNDYLSATITITSEMSFTCWLKFNAGGSYYILDCRSTASGNPGYQPLYAGVDYGLQFYTASSGSLNVSASNCGFATGTWYHLALTISNNGIKAYVNGNLVGSNSNTGYDFGPQTLKVGTGCTNQNWFNGLLNDLRVYDHALTPKEVKKISQGLILHYNPDYVCGYNLLNSYDMYTKDNPFTSNLANGDGISTLSIGCDVVNGKIYTLSADMDGTVVDVHGHNEGVDKKSCSIWLYFKTQTWAEGAYGTYKTPVCYTRLSPNFRRISKTRYAWTLTAPTDTTIKSCSIRVNTYSDGTHPVLVHFWNFKLEEGEVATPFSLIRDSQALDSSGFCHDGTIVSEAIEKSTDHRYKKNVVADGNPEHYIQSNINPSFLTSGVTFNVWYKNITNKTFLVANGQSINHYVMAINDVNKYCNNVSGAAYYIDGQLRTTADGYPKDGQWHMYTSVHTSIGSWTALYWNKYNSQWRYNGPLGDIRLYATALSAADVKNLYNETRVTHPMQFLISNSSALSSLTSSNPVLADGELVVVRSTDSGGKTYFNIRKGNGVNNFNSLPWKQVSETVLKGWRSSFVSDTGSLTADKDSYSNLK